MLISIADYARKRNVSYQAVARAIKTGRISLIDGKIDPAVADIQWEANRRRAPNVTDASSKSPPRLKEVALEADDGVPSLEVSRRRREHHEANIAEMRERQKAGELVILADVHLAYTTLAAELRAALERIPDKLAARLVEADSTVIHKLLTDEIDQALMDMAKQAETLPKRLSAGAKAVT